MTLKIKCRCYELLILKTIILYYNRYGMNHDQSISMVLMNTLGIIGTGINRTYERILNHNYEVNPVHCLSFSPYLKTTIFWLNATSKSRYDNRTRTDHVRLLIRGHYFSSHDLTTCRSLCHTMVDLPDSVRAMVPASEQTLLTGKV